MKKTLVGAAMLATMGAAQAADLGDVNAPIKLAINEWTGQHVSTHIAGEMLKKAGYKVEYTTAGYMNMYQAHGGRRFAWCHGNLEFQRF